MVCRTPYVTGTSVLGITYKDGVMIAADTLGAHILLNNLHIERTVQMYPHESWTDTFAAACVIS